MIESERLYETKLSLMVEPNERQLPTVNRGLIRR